VTPRGVLRLIGGLLVAALWLPSLLYFVSRGWEKEFSSFIVAYYTVPLTLVVAGPLVYILRKKLTLARCLTVDLLLGVLGALTFWSPYSLKAMLNWGPLLMVVGVVSSFLFWVVGVWRNRDLTFVGAGREG
jgi:hypothetical protein